MKSNFLCILDATILSKTQQKCVNKLNLPTDICGNNFELLIDCNDS